MFGIYAQPYFADPSTVVYEYSHRVAWLWMITGAAAILIRTTWLCVNVDFRHGIVWMTKILTDPFHDAKIYCKAPLKLLQGEKLDPMIDWPSPTKRL